MTWRIWQDVLDDKLTSVYNNKCPKATFVGLSPPTPGFDPSTGEPKGGGAKL